jgi:hypothetical protein
MAAAIVAWCLQTGHDDFVAAFTSTVWDDFKCILYCNSSSDGSYSQGEFDEILSEVQAKTGLAWDFFELVLTVIQQNGLTYAAAIHTATSADCSACECILCHQFSFAAGSDGWTLINPPTVWDSGGLYDGSSGYDAVRFSWPAALSIYLVDVTLIFNANWTGSAPRIYVQNQDGSTTYTMQDGAGGTSVTVSVNADITGLRIIADRYNGNIQHYGTLRLTGLHVRYRGDESFGGENCP